MCCRKGTPLLLLVSAVLLSECSTKDPETPFCYLTGYTETPAVGTGGTAAFTYNDKHQVISVLDGSLTNFTYSSNGNVQTASISNGLTWTYAFDSNNRVIQRVTSPGDQTLTIAYNSNGQAVLITYVDPNCGPCTNTRELTYPNSTTHNYSEETFTNSAGIITFSYTYDTHPNPFKPVPYWLKVGETDNNIITQVMTSPGGITNYAYVYTYNQRGYPFLRTASDGGTATYTYNCP